MKRICEHSWAFYVMQTFKTPSYLAFRIHTSYHWCDSQVFVQLALFAKCSENYSIIICKDTFSGIIQRTIHSVLYRPGYLTISFVTFIDYVTGIFHSLRNCPPTACFRNLTLFNQAWLLSITIHYYYISI